MERAAKRELTRLTPVAVAWSSDGRLDAQHHDLTGAMVALSDALGTTSDDFRDVQLGMLDYASRERGEARGKSAAALNASLALVEAIAPQNELEAALAVQMSGVHNLTGELLGRAKQTDRTDYIALYGGLAVKLARTFTAQVEALAKLRGGGKQQVEVRHVYVNGNAVIGDVHAGGGGGAGNERQPHAPALSHAPGETLPGALAAEREAVPSAGREGPDAL
ncbi:MAG: hypothetical protein ACRED9_10875 [Caulobacteraceae bacterium]